LSSCLDESFDGIKDDLNSLSAVKEEPGLRIDCSSHTCFYFRVFTTLPCSPRNSKQL